MLYEYQLKSPARRDRKFIKLSVKTKMPMSDVEMNNHIIQYAINHQLGTNQIIMQCVLGGKVIKTINPYGDLYL